MKTIEPDIQNAILKLLPNDEHQARLIMAQLAANIILSQEASIKEFVEEIARQYYSYIIAEGPPWSHC